MKIIKNRFFLAAICIAAAAGLMVFYASSFTSAQKTVQAYKVKTAVTKGMLLTESMLSPVSVNITGLPELVTDKEKIIGETATADLAAGQLIFAGNLAAETGLQNLEQLLDGSRMAYSITVGSLAAGVSGTLISNDIVSVYVSKDGSSTLPPELTYVPVLFASTSDGKDQAETDESKTATVTLLVTPAQALILNQYEYTSDTHLALVYRGDPEVSNQFLEKQAQALEAMAKPRKVTGGTSDGE